MENLNRLFLSSKVLLILPPFTQLNTPYPATAYLKGFLNTQRISAHQCDLGIEVILKMFSAHGLRKVFEKLAERNNISSENSRRIIALKDDYISTIDLVISFLQHKSPTLAHAICENDFLPMASRFNQADDLEWAFGTMGQQDKARHLATLYLEDLSDLVKDELDPHFGFSRYAESLGRSAASFDELDKELKKPNSFTDEMLLELLADKMKLAQPSLLAISVPFPGNLYAGLKCGQWVKKNYPSVKIALGGGFANTELRSLSDPRVFDYLDFVTLDDGEAPIKNLLEFIDGKRPADQLLRTFMCEQNSVVYCNGSAQEDYAQSEVGTPDYSDLFLEQYLSVIEIANPMHSLWSNGRWNKLTLAHGCYWGKCTFCDVSLDYIKRYEQTAAPLICDRIEELIVQTGERGFHFVDEAAPPALLRDLAIEILRRDLKITWWTNIRFEKSFTHDLCRLLKASGCIAMSGGLEVASDRLLALIDKGVTVAQVAKVCRNFTESGILVHAYLMYGYPTQTVQETVDSLEMVRQLFEANVLQSGFWHRFAMTAHSPVGMNPSLYKTKVINAAIGTFANNDLEYMEESPVAHEMFSEGLRISLYNYMHGAGFDLPLQHWFENEIPLSIISKNYINTILNTAEAVVLKPTSKVLFIGPKPILERYSKTKKARRSAPGGQGKAIPMVRLRFISRQGDDSISFDEETGTWLFSYFEKLLIGKHEVLLLKDFRADFEKDFPGKFDSFMQGEGVAALRMFGFLSV